MKKIMKWTSSLFIFFYQYS